MGSEVERFEPQDLAPYAAGFLVVIVFPESKSKNLAMAVEIASGAREYRSADLGGRAMHLAAFGPDGDQIARGRSLLRVVAGWRGAQVFAGGRLISGFNADEVLHCFQSAAAIADHRLHCEVGDEFGGWHPCRLLARATGPLCGSTAEAQAQQVRLAALRRGVEWCPFLGR